MSHHLPDAFGSTAYALTAAASALVFVAAAPAQVPPLDFSETVFPDVVLETASFPQAGDMNGDGLMDILWIDDHSKASRVLAGDGLGGFSLLGGGLLSQALPVWHAVSGDMDGDGSDDLVTVNINESTYIHRSLGTGSFALLDVEPTGFEPNETCVADLDEDGDLDVVSCWGDALFDAGLHVARNNGSGMVSASYHFEPSSGYARVRHVEAADFDGDGVQDLLASTDRTVPVDSAVLLFKGLGNASFSGPIVLHTDPDWGYLARSADLDNDGWVDFVGSAFQTAPFQFELESFLNGGGGVFGAPVPVGIGQVGALRDLNGDGIADAIVTPLLPSGSFAATRVARGLGDGTFLPAEFVGTTFPDGVPDAVGRLDQNLSWDLFEPDAPTKDLHVLLNDQAGSPFETAGPPLAGVAGEPRLWGSGTTLPGETVTVTLVDAKPSAPVVLVIGGQLISVPFKGGLLGPSPNLLIVGLLTNGLGRITLTTTWPAGVPFGLKAYLQMWIDDPAAVQGRAASNTLRLTAG